MSKKDPLPTTEKFCFFFELKPAVTTYIIIEYVVWVLFLLSALSVELDCLETTDLMEIEAILRRDLYFKFIFGEVQGMPHETMRCECSLLFYYFNLDRNSFFSFSDFSQHNPRWGVSTLLHLHAFAACWTSQGLSKYFQGSQIELI